MQYNELKRKYVGLDLLRVLSAFIICMFHTTCHLGCDYGLLQNFSLMGAVFMTAFFMLSGFSLFINWGGYNLTNIQNVKRFWLKRFISVIPMYWLVLAIYKIAMLIVDGGAVAISIMALTPIDILGLQSVFSSLFDVSHNGGTWFISCILICYLVYPFVQEIVIRMNKKNRKIILFICVFILLYSPLIVYQFRLMPIYSNPFFRLLEFIIGMLLAAMKIDFKDSTFIHKYIYNWWTVVAVFLLMIVGVSTAVRLKISIGNYMLYSWICLPCFIIILFGLSGVESKMLNKSRFIKWMSSISYVFFLSQLFSNKLSKRLISVASLDNNIAKILIGWSMCFAIAVVFRFIEVRVKALIQKRISI